MRTKPKLWQVAATLFAAGLLVWSGPTSPALAGPGARAAAAAAVPGNLAAGKPTSESSHTDVYPSGNVTDSNQDSYWESANNAFPQWVQVDLGASTSVNKVVLKLPGATSWATRSQTVSVSGSSNNSTFTTIVNATAYTFNPSSANTVTITFATTSARYLRLTFTANTGWPAGQLSEFEVYGPSTTDTQAPTAPSGLAYTQPASGQIRLTWNAATDNVGVTTYEIVANDAVRGTTAGNVLTYTDTQPDSATVSYYVRARDAAGNISAASNTVTRTGSGTGTGGTNLALGKPITASGSVFTFVPANANDNNLATYWEGASGVYPSTLTVSLGANAAVNQVIVKLNPDSSWGTRTQTIQVLGREQSSSTFTSLSAATVYTFNPATSNTVTIPVSATVADVRLSITSNSGAPAGQAAEFQVIGTAAPNPDLTVTASSWSPASPVETDSVTASATVRNAGTAASAATSLNFYLGATKVGTATVPAIAAGGTATVSANVGPQTAGSYQLTAKVDEANTVIELDEGNNSYTNPATLTVAPVQSSDLVAAASSWSPSNPAAGTTVTFSVAVKNQGTIASGGGSHGITVTVLDQNNTVVKTLTGSVSGVIAAGATSAPVNLGAWTAANGKYTVRTVIAVDANELSVKQANNTSTQPLFVGRGANMPYDMYEAEDGTVGGGASVIGPNRTIGDLAGEASGRKAVTLGSTGSYVQWTTKAQTNTLVTRFSMPDASGGGGQSSTLDIYVNNTFLKAIPLTSHFAWLYGDEKSPTDSPGSGAPRHIYDEANIMLGTTVPQGSTIKLQKDAANGSTYTIDFINLEQVSPIANPDPASYITPAGFTQQDVQNAFDTARQSTTAVGVYLPAGTYDTTGKFSVYGKALKVVGAGPWYTRFQTPQTQSDTDAGFRIETSANGSTFSGFSFFGNYTTRIDGPGKVFGELKDNQNLTIDNVWVEHTVCMYWGVHNNNITITNSRIRDTFADGINFTNDTTNSHISNDDARSTGDDSFALFSATDQGGSVGNNGNLFENLSATLTWRAAGVAVYGGFNNTFRNLYIADMLAYPGITISSLDFGYPFVGFGTQPTTISNVSLIRDGGHFWGQQTFGAIWMFSASKEFRGIRLNDIDIVDPTYSGIMFQTNYTNPTTPQNPITDTILTNVTISGAQRSGDAFDAKSGFGLWANEMPEANQGPAVGSVTFNGLTFSNNAVNIRNTTSTFTININ
jgi:hypothetical protein